MPDLEKQISAWRAQMMSAGVKSSDVLNELEGHLREEIDEQVRNGLSPL